MLFSSNIQEFVYSDNLCVRNLNLPYMLSRTDNQKV